VPTENHRSARRILQFVLKPPRRMLTALSQSVINVAEVGERQRASVPTR
jgi:hypothetical protein